MQNEETRGKSRKRESKKAETRAGPRSQGRRKEWRRKRPRSSLKAKKTLPSHAARRAKEPATLVVHHFWRKMTTPRPL